MKDMDIEKYLNIQGEQSTEQIFSLLYDYLDQYRLQICRILLKNNLEGRCMADYYAATLEMLLEKVFFHKGTAKQRGSITSSSISAWQCGKGGS